MDWFGRLTGFREGRYGETRAKLEVDGRLASLPRRRKLLRWEFELVSLRTLRRRAASVTGMSGRLKVSVVTGDVRQMHQATENVGALFQVASQLNALEMTGPNVMPKMG